MGERGVKKLGHPHFNSYIRAYWCTQLSQQMLDLYLFSHPKSFLRPVVDKPSHYEYYDLYPH